MSPSARSAIESNQASQAYPTSLCDMAGSASFVRAQFFMRIVALERPVFERAGTNQLVRRSEREGVGAITERAPSETERNSARPTHLVAVFIILKLVVW